VAAGVSGGECTAVVGGDGLGEGSFEPACICLLLGVATPEFVPDGTFGEVSIHKLRIRWDNCVP
jgi:hypothetical protein